MLSPDTANANQPALTMRWLPGRYAVCRLPHKAPLPDWAGRASGLSAIIRTADELTIIADESHIPSDHPEVAVETGWMAMRVVGRLDFGLVGILARLTGALADANVPVFAVSTYDTDILLVKAEHSQRAETALRSVATFE